MDDGFTRLAKGALARPRGTGREGLRTHHARLATLHVSVARAAGADTAFEPGSAKELVRERGPQGFAAAQCCGRGPRPPPRVTLLSLRRIPGSEGGATPSAGPRSRAPLPTWVLVAMVAAVGLNMRASVGVIPPLLDDINADLHLSNTAAGLVTSLALAFMGLCAPVGQRIGVRLGSEATTGWAMLLLALAGLVRFLPGGAPLLFVSAAVTGAAIGSVSALMPALIGHHLAGIRGLATGIYSTGTALGLAVAAGTAIPLERLLGGWRPALGAWGVAAAVTAAGWLLLTPRLSLANRAEGSAGLHVDYRMPWRSRTAWWVTLFMTAQMVVGFSGMAWISPYYASLGLGAQESANLLVLFQVVQLVSMLTLPALTDHLTDRRPLLAFGLSCITAGVAMLLIDPLGLAVPSTLLFGAGVGGGFTLGLVLIIDNTSNQVDAARLSAMVLLVAFLGGATGPLALGILRDLTGGFAVGYAVLLVISTLVLVTTVVYRPGRTIHD